MTSSPHSIQDDFAIVRQGLVRDGHDRFAALGRIEEQYESLRASLRTCPYCAHTVEWQDSDPPEGPCAGCRRSDGLIEQFEALREAGQRVIDFFDDETGQRPFDDCLVRLRDELAVSSPANSHGCERHAQFDRTICACGDMHYYCSECGKQLDPCNDSSPAKRPS